MTPLAKDLPPELKAQVVGFAAPREVVRLESVSRGWHAVGQDHWRFLKPPIVHRPWRDQADMKRVLCERDAMVTSMFPPADGRAVPGLPRPTPTALGDELYGRKLVQAALVAWSAADIDWQEPARAAQLARALSETRQFEAALDAAIPVAMHQPDRLFWLVRSAFCHGSVEVQQRLIEAWRPSAVELQMVISRADADTFHEDIEAPIVWAAATYHPIPPQARRPALLFAAGRGDLALAERALAAGSEGKEFVNDALYAALCSGHLPVIERLVAAGAQVQDLPDRRPLLLAALASGDFNTALWALSTCPRTNIPTAHGDTVWVALIEGSKKLTPTDTRALLDALMSAFSFVPYDPYGPANTPMWRLNLSASDAASPLRAAAASLGGGQPGLSALVLALLELDKTTPVSVVHFTQSLNHGDAAVVRAFMHRVRVVCAQQPPLLEAVRLRRPAWVPLLVSAGIDISAPTAYWFKRDTRHVFAYLIEQLQESKGDALDDEGLAQVAEALIAAGADVNAQSLADAPRDVLTPLMLTMSIAEPKPSVYRFARALLEHGADVHAVDNDGRTALHMCQDPAMRALLCEFGARPDALDYHWRPAIPGTNGIMDVMDALNKEQLT